MIELVLAPHPDDEAIGCGGVIAQNSSAGDRVLVVFLTSGECGVPGLAPDEAGRLREQEAAAAAEILGVADMSFLRLPDGNLGAHGDRAAADLAHLLLAEPPDIVRLPHPEDGHADHHAIWPIIQKALRVADVTRPEILAYEIWTPMQAPDYAEDITAFMEAKLAAIRCYRSQLEQLPYDWGISGLNAYRGALVAGSRYAEAVSYLWPADLGNKSG